MIEASRHRSRRLRKKLRLGEFQEFGFEVGFTLSDTSTEEEAWAFWDTFLDEAIESHGLKFGGGDSGGFICGVGRMPVSEALRALVVAWLQARPEVANLHVGPLVEAWHD